MSPQRPEDRDANTPGDEAGSPEGGLPAGVPSRAAFLLAFGSVVLAGVLGGVIGFGLVDLSCTRNCEGSQLLGTLAGAVLGAAGVGVVAVLVLRAMSEWKRRSRAG